MKHNIGKRHVFDGLYIFNSWAPRSVACPTILSPIEAHSRLGHPSLSFLKLCP